MAKATTKQQRVIDAAWMGLEDINTDGIFNPMSILKPNDPDYHLKLTWLMTKPENFSFLCKHLLNIDLLPSQALMLCELWNRRFPMLIASRGFGKSFILSLYAILRALLIPKRKVIIVGAAFRQSKVLFEYMETIWNNAPILRSICTSNCGPRRDIDRCVMRILESRVTCLPLGDGTKIRGQRAHDILADEFASIPRDIFETVVVGFGAVSSTPIENVKKLAAKLKAAELNVEFEDDDGDTVTDNQMVLSGTAYYDFNHFASYWKNWRAIINSAGDKNKLRSVFSDNDPPPEFNWKDYSVIRMPYELLPEGFMDAAQVARSKATIHAGIYQMEYGAVFTSDSQGFFKRSLIESCVANEENRIMDNNGPIIFEPMLIGDPNKKYVFGIDPASEIDNFSIVVLELNPGHNRIVYCWTTTRSQHREKLKKGYVKEKAFYDYCSRKIRDLMRLFPCVHISMDKQGGGVAVMESLHDDDKIQQGELPIWPIIDPDKEADTDDEKGLHILELCQNANNDWYLEANHGLRKDFEDKSTLFPRFDSISLGLSNIEDGLKGRMFDTLEECVLEIEELKNELSMIQMTQTANGRDRWDTPEIIVGAGKKDKMRKDRYSALMVANMAARTIARKPSAVDYNFYGGFANGQIDMDVELNKNKSLYTGPNWFADGMKDIY